MLKIQEHKNIIVKKTAISIQIELGSDHIKSESKIKEGEIVEIKIKSSLL